MDLFKNNKALPFWLLTFSVILVLIVSQLIQDGMFMDGLLYTCAGKNLADGLGSFWNPHVSKTIMYSFHEQPPLYFGLLASFFKIFGGSMYTERLFCFTFFIGTAIYIHKLWRKIYSGSEMSSLSWLPILFWVTIPSCFWAYTNHVEEIVMAFFALAATYHIFIALHEDENPIYNLVVAGIMIFLSSLTKGAQGLFPVIGAGAYWLISKKLSFGKTLFYSGILIGIPAFIYCLLLAMDPEVYASYHTYFNIRYVRVFNGAESTTDNHFDIIEQLFMQLLPVLAFTFLVVILRRNKGINEKINSQNQRGIFLWILMIGLAGSLPLAITLVQRSFYLVTSLPYFAIAIAMIIAPYLNFQLEKMSSATKSFRIFKIIGIVFFTGALVFTATRIGKCKRDEALLSDVYAFGKIIPHGDITGIPQEMMNDWSTRYYLLRYFYINLDTKGKSDHYFIARKDLPMNLIPPDYKPYPVKTNVLDLYVHEMPVKK
jgi:hypothetical protein